MQTELIISIQNEVGNNNFIFEHSPEKGVAPGHPLNYLLAEHSMILQYSQGTDKVNKYRYSTESDIDKAIQTEYYYHKNFRYACISCLCMSYYIYAIFH